MFISGMRRAWVLAQNGQGHPAARTLERRAPAHAWTNTRGPTEAHKHARTHKTNTCLH